MELNHQWYRPITHHTYSKKSEWNCMWLNHYIHKSPFWVNQESLGPKYILYVDQKYYSQHDYGIGGLVNGSIAFVFFLMFSHLPYGGDDFSLFGLFIDALMIIFILLCFIYYFTAKKEFILNRLDGTITFPGWLWMKNVTMPFSEVIFRKDLKDFIYIVRPQRYVPNYLLLTNNFDSSLTMSFFTWFMDKNRPLPPGTAFDPYREEDFERRKAEGFPSPMYGSSIPTPEASKEHEKEKMRFLKERNQRRSEAISRWYDPKIDKDWILTKCKDILKYGSEYSKTYKYTFEDGTIIFVKKEVDKVMMPPCNMKYDLEAFL